MNEKTFWQRIKQLIKNTNTSQRVLTEFMGIPFRTLENWMYRSILPMIQDGYLIAQFFGVCIEYLITGRERKDQMKISAIRSLVRKTDKKLSKL